MISGLTPAHITLNCDYVVSFFQKVNYSGALMQFLDPSDSRFHLYFIGNDTSGIADFVSRDAVVDRINLAIMPELWNVVSSDGINATEIITGFNFMNHIPIQSVNDYYMEAVASDTISVSEAVLDDIALLLK
jgi:hypothetical protein